MDHLKEILRAADEGRSNEIRKLLAASPELVNASGDHCVTPLHAAAEKDQLEAARVLIEAGADLEAETTWGMTPLEWAANMGSRRVGQLLLSAGARLNVWSAAGLGLLERVESFLDGPGRLKPGAAQARHHQLLNGEWEKLPPPDDFREAISDAFYVACRNGHTEVGRFLLAQGADIGFRGFFGGTPLHWAAMNGHRETVEFLLESGARRDLRDNQFKSTPREWAKETHHDEIAALLA